MKELVKFAEDNGSIDELEDISLRDVIGRNKEKMKSNFRPNMRLAKNILFVIGTFAIALRIAPIAELFNEKNLFIKYLKHQIDRDKLIKRLKIIKQANPSSICESILKS